MNFKDKLNEYLKITNCSSKELSTLSNISETVISRYRDGQRVPKTNSKQLKSISGALEKIIKDKNITQYKDVNIYEEFTKLITNNDSFNYEIFSKNFNELIITLKININELSKNIVFDSSHISRIRYGKSKPADPFAFSIKVANFISSKYDNENNLKNISVLTEKDTTKENIYNVILEYLTNNSETKIENKNHINDFLNNLNNFNLNDYIKAIKFDELKIPYIPFYKQKSKTYYGLEEMKKAELDFFKANVLTKSSTEIFMCSDMPMEDMAKDVDFGKKWMFGVAMCLKKGLHLNIIHNLDRPFNEMMLGLESWVPIYMTGQVSPYYIKNSKDSVYGHLNYVSNNYALYGECIKGHHENGKYYLTSNTKEIEYYHSKAKYLLKTASPLMEIYNNENSSLFKTFLLNETKIHENRKRYLNSLPLFTISDTLLDKILIRNNISKTDIIKIKEYKKAEEKNIKEILKTNEITDIIPNNKEVNNMYLSLENIFYDKKILYTNEEYKKHLKSTLNYKNKNYKTIISNNSTFNNISITIFEDSQVIISKSSNPVIHFVIKHPKLISAIKNFTPLVKESE